MSTKKSTTKSQPVCDERIAAGILPEFTTEFKELNIEALQGVLDDIIAVVNFDLTDVQRRRLIASGIRNYGFLDKASDLAAQHTELLPPKFSVTEFKALIRSFEFLRDLLSIVRSLDRAVSNAFFVYSDEAFRMALRFYNTVRELARTGDTDAIAVFNMLRPYFSRTRRKSSDEPTEHEVERDIKALLHGTKDGEIIVKNEKPRLVGGKHVVVDETHKAKEHWKATEEGEIEE